jgi:hypothetical protein
MSSCLFIIIKMKSNRKNNSKSNIRLKSPVGTIPRKMGSLKQLYKQKKTRRKTKVSLTRKCCEWARFHQLVHVALLMVV